MQPGLLYLNDFRAQLYVGSERLLSESSLLLTEDNQIITGDPALARARLEPAKISSQHWQQLNQTPLSPARSGFRHHADLAYRQLEQWLATPAKASGIAIASSLMFDANQQALLAGMCKAAGAPLQGYIPAPLLQAAGFFARSEHRIAGRFYHLELSQQDALLTELAFDGGQLQLLRQIPIPDQGAGPLLNRWLNCLAKECVRQTRYDPLHTAESEQRLFNLLLPALKHLADGENELEIDGNRVKLDTEWLNDISAPLRQRIAAQVSDSPLLLSPLALRLPKLKGQQLEDADLVRGFELLAPALADGPLKAHKSLAIQQAARQPETQTASHLLAGNQAFALSQKLNLSKQGNIWQPLAADSSAADLSLSCNAHGLALPDSQWQYHPQHPQLNRPQAGDTLTHPQFGELRFIRLETMPDGA